MGDVFGKDIHDEGDGQRSRGDSAGDRRHLRADAEKDGDQGLVHRDLQREHQGPAQQRRRAQDPRDSCKGHLRRRFIRAESHYPRASPCTAQEGRAQQAIQLISI